MCVRFITIIPSLAAIAVGWLRKTAAFFHGFPSFSRFIASFPADAELFSVGEEVRFVGAQWFSQGAPSFSVGAESPCLGAQPFLLGAELFPLGGKGLPLGAKSFRAQWEPASNAYKSLVINYYLIIKTIYYARKSFVPDCRCRF